MPDAPKPASRSDEYRKKPVVIRATQWHQHGDHPEVQPHGYGMYDPHSLVTCDSCKQPMFLKDSFGGMGRLTFTHGQIKTLESSAGSAHIVCPGDWIITGIKGEHYACKPDIFAATYEPAGAVSERGDRKGRRALALIQNAVQEWDRVNAERTQSIADEPWHISEGRKLLSERSEG